MIVRNHTEYPATEVRRLIELGYGRGRRPRRVVVYEKHDARDSELGFTPFDSHQATEFWLDPPGRYPQVDAHSWRDQLRQSAAHEAYHFRHSGRCESGHCPNQEVPAEREARKVAGLSRRSRRWFAGLPWIPH